ncbi:MAG TPA: class I SAM-dependent methyltransferase, partial [Ramlibacter sp.]|nr:class I SAM-dependent methyltransferase [Ramlibacter sp.]
MPQARSCPVCSTPGERSTLFLEGNFDPARLSGFSFASRKTPEFMSHRLVRCPNCELVYVAQPPAEHVLAAAYHEAAYDSAQEAQDAASAYAKAV